MPLTGSTPPITEEDQDAIKAMIKKLVRFRKREHAHGKKHYVELDDSIKSLKDYGVMKGWWKDQDDTWPF